MLGQQFYHETMRKVVVAFGTMFNDINLVRTNNAGEVIQTMKVPLAYGPKQKWLARLQEDPNITKKVAVTLPRLGFEIQTISYDSTRKLNSIQKLKKVNSSAQGKTMSQQFMPVPYNMDFQMAVMAKNSDDALQIVEQILPFFQPDYTVTLNDNTAMGTTRDVPIVLTNVGYEDNYEADLITRRAIIYTLDFTAKFYLYGPVTDQKVIKTVQVDQYTDSKVNAPKREQRYSVAPNPASADADDDFGFNETTSFFEDAKNYDETTGTDTDDA
jgi:hypothetical protein|tara:strand:- start:276 stop:1088 length:813 start_codon:yes stop_codon:yes gene_type:complete